MGSVIQPLPDQKLALPKISPTKEKSAPLKGLYIYLLIRLLLISFLDLLYPHYKQLLVQIADIQITYAPFYQHRANPYSSKRRTSPSIKYLIVKQRYLIFYYTLRYFQRQVDYVTGLAQLQQECLGKTLDKINLTL